MSDLLNSASLVLIPSGYKEDVVYSAVPTDGSGDLSFTRASNGTRINSAGLVEVTPWNLLEQSETFDNAYWSKVGVGTGSAPTVTANYGVAPNGTTTADRVVFNTGAGTSSGDRSILRASGLVLTDNCIGGFYIKSNTGSSQTIGFHNGGQIDVITVTTSWVRYNTSIAASVSFFGLENLGSNSTAGTCDVLVWGAQLNIGSTAKPYFPTTDRLNVPRLTYQNGGGGCPSLLLEKQSTNVLTYSNTSDWGLSPTVTKTQNTTDLLSPDGTNNATKVVSTAGTGDTSQGFSVPDGAATFSFYGKVASGTKTLVIDVRNNSGTVTSLSPVLTTEWQRFTLTNATAGTGSSGAVWIYPNGAGTFYIYGAQVEVGSYATSLILTSGASATRVADACFKTGISSLIGQTEGVIFVDWNYENKQDSNGSIPLVINGSAGEAYIFVTGGGTLLGELYNSGVQASITGGIGAVGRKKIAFAYKQNDFALYMNGVQIGTDTSGTVGSMTAVTVGGYYASSYQANSGINQAILFPTRLTNAELASLTTI